MTDDATPPAAPRGATAEHARLAEATGAAEDDLFEANPWYEWGPYLSERAWGTVREDYSDSGDAWGYFPHDHARSRAYRWNEDGMAGLSDIRHDLCLGLALWNGADPILKERMFGLTGPQGNHGEDVKEYWWYLGRAAEPRLAAVAVSLPAGGVPVPAAGRGERPAVPGRTRVRAAGHRRLRRRPLLVGGCRLREGVPDRGPGPDHHREPRTRGGGAVGVADPVVPQHLAGLGRRARRRCSSTATASPSSIRGCPDTGSTPPPPDGIRPQALFCDNETNTARGCSGRPRSPPIPKDGINDHVVSGAETVNPQQRGTKAAWWYRVTRAGRGQCRDAAAAAPARPGPGHTRAAGLGRLPTSTTS